MIAAAFLAWQTVAQDEHQLDEWDRAFLTTPGGPLYFGLDLERKDEGWRAFISNGDERIEVTSVAWNGKDLVLDFPHYDSRIRASLQGDELVGTWEKRRSATEIARVPFEALPRRICNRTVPVTSRHARPLSGKWSVHFEDDEKPAVAEFVTDPDWDLKGTFLTATGDYRYLSGSRTLDELTLSCFDGAHAFLFKAQLQPDGTLAGDFWSGNWSHDTWTAKRDADAHLDDPFAQTHWNGKTKLADLRFPDLDGRVRALGDPELAGKAYLLVVFGSWCPNCNDEAQFLAELDAKYRDQGLRILGLAFELTGERERDANQVRIFAERHGLTFPMFLCGTNDKDEATKALNLVDQVRAFPTTIFVGADGLVRAIHSGYSGPATGKEHARLRAEFERRIAELLGTPPR